MIYGMYNKNWKIIKINKHLLLWISFYTFFGLVILRIVDKYVVWGLINFGL